MQYNLRSAVRLLMYTAVVLLAGYFLLPIDKESDLNYLGLVVGAALLIAFCVWEVRKFAGSDRPVATAMEMLVALAVFTAITDSGRARYDAARPTQRAVLRAESRAKIGHGVTGPGAALWVEVEYVEQIEPTSGTADLDEDSVMLSTKHEGGRSVGDTVEVTMGSSTKELTVVGFYDEIQAIGSPDVLMSVDTVESMGGSAADNWAFIFVDGGVDRAAVEADIEAILDTMA